MIAMGGPKLTFGHKDLSMFQNGIAKLATQGRLRFYLKNLNWQLFFGGKKTLSCRPSTESTRIPFALCRLSMSLHPPQQTYKPSQRLKQRERTTRKQNNQPPTMTSLGHVVPKNAKNPLNPATGTEFLPPRRGVAAAKTPGSREQ